MYLVVIAWLYVALMMAVAEATHSAGTVLGAFFTFVLYGAVPVALVIYLGGRPALLSAGRQTHLRVISRSPGKLTVGAVLPGR